MMTVKLLNQLLGFLVVTLWFLNSGEGKADAVDTDRKETNVTEILDSLLGRSDKRIRPNYGGPPVTIAVNMDVYSFGPVHTSDMEYSMNIFFRQVWNDPRLKFNGGGPLYFSSEMIQGVWVPDTYFENEKEARYHEVTSQNALVRIESNGDVFFSIRLTVVSSCPLDLRLFPFDAHKCTLSLGSYAYTTDDIIYEWSEFAVTVSAATSLPQFNLYGYATSNTLVTYPVGDYRNLNIHFYLTREISYYVVHTFIPASLIVVVSWISFWLPKHATPARVSLGITTVLSMTTVLGDAGKGLPKFSNINSMDIFLGVCYVYVFLAFLEYAFVSFTNEPPGQVQATLAKKDTEIVEGDVNTANKNNNDEYPRSRQTVRKESIHMAVMGDASNVDDDRKSTLHQSGHPSTFLDYMFVIPNLKYHRDDKDYCSRIIFPVTFLLFQICYWVTFTVFSKNKKEAITQTAEANYTYYSE